MTIESSFASVSVASGEDRSSVDIHEIRELSGFAAGFRFYPKYGFYCLAARDDQPGKLWLIILPSEKWEGDLTDAGYRVVQRLHAGLAQSTPTAA